MPGNVTAISGTAKSIVWMIRQSFNECQRNENVMLRGS